MMARFDPEVWVGRARARCTKERAAKKPGAKARLEHELKCINALKNVAAWCETKKIKVTFDNEDEGGYHDKKIRCNVNMRPAIQLYTVLHECGHFLIGVENKKFALSTSDEADPSVKRTTVAYRIDVLCEELEAWHRGWRLAERLKLKLNKSEYDELRAKKLKTYAEWVMQPKGFEKKGGED